METLKVIEEQIAEIKKLSPNISLDKILVHIESAELLYKEGQNSKNDNFFTDVIYRTNQAFEGSLRQAFMILADINEKQANKKRTIEIEEFLMKKKILNERVLHFFRNYRQEWRNKSTHDFQLFFSQSEAFLAIVNVSAYVHVLLNQIMEKLAYDEQKEKLKKSVDKVNTIQSFLIKNELSIRDIIIELIKEFSLENGQLTQDLKEIELIGMFSAFLQTASPNIIVNTDFKLEKHGNHYRFDMLIAYKNEKIIIEVKKPTTFLMYSHENQLLEYLKVSETEKGILWYPKRVSSKDNIEIKSIGYIMKITHQITTIK